MLARRTTAQLAECMTLFAHYLAFACWVCYVHEIAQHASATSAICSTYMHQWPCCPEPCACAVLLQPQWEEVPLAGRSGQGPRSGTRHQEAWRHVTRRRPGSCACQCSRPRLHPATPSGHRALPAQVLPLPHPLHPPDWLLHFMVGAKSPCRQVWSKLDPLASLQLRLWDGTWLLRQLIASHLRSQVRRLGVLV